MQTFSLNNDVHKTLLNTNLMYANPVTDAGRNWWSEALVKSMEDRVSGNVNVDAYGFACERNTRMAISDREVPLLTVEEVEMGRRGVAESVASYLDKNVDTIIESSEVSTLVETFLMYQDQLEIEEGVNLYKLFTLAMKGNVKMVDKLRDIVTRYNIGSLIESVLTNVDCVPALEVAMA